MRPPLEVIVSIARAVEKAGGDMDDVRDLVQTWERVQARTQPKADAMRRQAANVRCCCADRPEQASDGRCSRCHGWPKAKGNASGGETTPTNTMVTGANASVTQNPTKENK